MAKIELKKEVVEKVVGVTLHLTEKEAYTLAAILGTSRGGNEFVGSVYDLLNAHGFGGINYDTENYDKKKKLITQRLIIGRKAK